MQKHRVNKHRAAKRFNRSVNRTKRINVAPPAPRGGYRL